MRVHLGLGSNLGDASGDRLAALVDALRRAEGLEGTKVIAVSSAYESEAWPDPEDPAFVNAVAIIETSLDLDRLLTALERIEHSMGREPARERNAPRAIDIDILLAEDVQLADEHLTVPHPKMAERDFVITPLLEVDPKIRWPDGAPIDRERVSAGSVIAKLGEVPGFARPPRLSAEKEPWETVMEFGSDPSFLLQSGAVPLGGMSGQVGMSGQIEGSFAELVLSQEGIPWAWEPFAPGLGSDPYGFSRRFQLKVPLSKAQEARDLLAALAAAPVDWSETDSSSE